MQDRTMEKRDDAGQDVKNARQDHAGQGDTGQDLKFDKQIWVWMM